MPETPKEDQKRPRAGPEFGAEMTAKRPPETSVGELIHARRIGLGLSLQTLGERVGCAKSYLSQVENGRRERPPGEILLRRLEDALSLAPGELVELARLERTPTQVRERLHSLEAQQRTAQSSAQRLARLLSGGLEGAGRSVLDSAHASGELERLVGALSGAGSSSPGEAGGGGSDAVITPLSREVPLINQVAAGYPSEFTDLGYPARIADEYVRVPDLDDPDAFAARVVGDSMEPEYHEGDVVIFSPTRDVRDGSDCFVRLEHDAETTFKRVYFEGEAGREMIRLQPLNSRFAPRTLRREEVAGLYAAVSVTRRIGK